MSNILDNEPWALVECKGRRTHLERIKWANLNRGEQAQNERTINQANYVQWLKKVVKPCRMDTWVQMNESA